MTYLGTELKTFGVHSKSLDVQCMAAELLKYQNLKHTVLYLTCPPFASTKTTV